MNCHSYEAERPPKRNWKHLFMECGRCFGPKVLPPATKMIYPDGRVTEFPRIWICRPCTLIGFEAIKKAMHVCNSCGEFDHATLDCPRFGLGPAPPAVSYTIRR